jgi:hypothetical protein
VIITKRQYLWAFALFAGLACSAVPALAQQPPTGVTVYTLAPDEEIVRPESTIAITADGSDVVLILSKGHSENLPFYVFCNGRKTGPYVKFEEAMKAAYKGQESAPSVKRDCAAYTPGDAPGDARPDIASAAGGKQVVRFKGKTFGPYLLVLAARATPDGSTAYFTASDDDKSWFGCTDGRVVSFGGLPTDFKFSPDGKSAAAMVQGKLSLAEMNNLGKLPPEKMAAAFKDQEKKYLYTIDGKSYGPFEGSFSSNSFWYPRSANDLYYRVDDDVIRNGALMFKAESFNDCSFYPSPDGKKYAMFTYESIVFSDGRTFPSPHDVIAVQRQGRTVFRWITLENNRKIVVYELAL